MELEKFEQEVGTLEAQLRFVKKMCDESDYRNFFEMMNEIMIEMENEEE